MDLTEPIWFSLDFTRLSTGENTPTPCRRPADYQQQLAGPVGRGRVAFHLGGHFAREGGRGCLCLFLWLGGVLLEESGGSSHASHGCHGDLCGSLGHVVEE